MVPRPGCTAVWPPSAEPIAQGLPGSPGEHSVDVVRPLAVGHADRVDRRQVDDREAHRRDRRQPPLGRLEACRSSAAPPPPTAGTSRTRPSTRPSSRSTQSWYGPAMRGVAEIRGSPHQPHGGFAGRELDPRLGRASARAELGIASAVSGPAVGLGDDRAARAGGRQRGAVGEVELDVDAGLEPDREVARPAAPDVEDARPPRSSTHRAAAA